MLLAVRAISVLLTILLTAPVRAEGEITIPVVDRPEKDFYNAAGTAVTVRWDAKPTELTINDWLTLTLTISGVQNPSAVTRPDLNKVEGFAKRFEFKDLKDPRPAAADQRVFAYQLRPVVSSVAAVPPLKFYYFNPKVPESLPTQLRFPFTTAASVPLNVTIKAAKTREVIPLDVPAFAEQLADSNELADRSSSSLNPFLLVLILALGPLVAVWWVVVWKHRYPDAARQTHLRQSRAARRAIADLERLRRRSVADPGAAAADVLLRYLHERVDLPAWARTPADVTDMLARANVALECVAAARQALQSCDAARFAPGVRADLEQIIAEAERVVQSLEGAT